MAHRKKWRLPLPSTVVINAVMVFVLVVVLIPMLNLVAKSFSDPAQVAGMSGWRIIPAGFSLINYQIIFSNPAIWRALFNSLFITVIGVALNVVVTSMAAYALTRPNLPGKKLFMAFFIMMMIFELLFFFALARYVFGVGTKLPRSLPALALCTGVFSLSGPVTQLAMRLNEEGIRYTAGSMATVTDFVIGAFALLMAFALIWKGQPDGTEDETREDAAQETPDPEKWEEIVGELTGSHSVLGAPADSKIPQDLSNSCQETERGS